MQMVIPRNKTFYNLRSYVTSPCVLAISVISVFILAHATKDYQVALNLLVDIPEKSHVEVFPSPFSEGSQHGNSEDREPRREGYLFVGALQKPICFSNVRKIVDLKDGRALWSSESLSKLFIILSLQRKTHSSDVNLFCLCLLEAENGLHAHDCCHMPLIAGFNSSFVLALILALLSYKSFIEQVLRYLPTICFRSGISINLILKKAVWRVRQHCSYCSLFPVSFVCCTCSNPRTNCNSGNNWIYQRTCPKLVAKHGVFDFSADHQDLGFSAEDISVLLTQVINLQNNLGAALFRRIGNRFCVAFWSTHLPVLAVEKMQKSTKSNFARRHLRQSTGFRIGKFPFVVIMFLLAAIRQPAATASLAETITPTKTPSGTHSISASVTLTNFPTRSSSPTSRMTGGDRRQDIINGYVACIVYNENDGIFSLVCSRFDMKDSSDFNMLDYITLAKNEVFEGNGNQIILHGVYKGLFQIYTWGSDAPSSLEDAPKIQHLHMIGGETKGDTPRSGAGFIIQASQKHFIVDSCSSSGEIKGTWSGGICGQLCSGDIKITNSSSSGDLTGSRTGGIAGAQIGVDGNDDNTKVQIFQCHSTGDIVGPLAGGICGTRTGDNGHVVITHSYFTGKIGGSQCGGICGGATGPDGGLVKIEQCYTEGEISEWGSGGISGDMTGLNGIVYITNSYSRGDISGSSAGGICGRETGINGGTVIITNVYASGKIVHSNAGGIIGEINQQAKEINVAMSVYNDGPIVRVNADHKSFTGEKNSGNVTRLTGQVYWYADDDQQECWNSETIWQIVNNDFPVLRPPPPPSPTVTATSSILPTQSATKSPSTTASVTSTGTSSFTGSVTPTGAATRTSSCRCTSSETATVSTTMTASVLLTPGNAESISNEFVSTFVLQAFGIPLSLIALMILCIFAVVYKRRKNQKRIRRNASLSELYLDELVRVSSQSDRLKIDQEVGSIPNLVSRKNNHLNASLSAIDNPLENSRRNRGSPVSGVSSKTTVTKHTEGKTGPLVRPSSLKGRGDSYNPLNSSMQLSGSSLPKVEIVNVGESPVDGKVGSVKIISLSAPKLGTGRNLSKDSVIRLALVSDIDKSGMSTISRTLLKARQWKAKLLAEPAPMVEVEVQKMPFKPILVAKSSVKRGTKESSTYDNMTTNPLTKTLISNIETNSRDNKTTKMLQFTNRVDSFRSAVAMDMNKESAKKRKRLVESQLRKKQFSATRARVPTSTTSHSSL